MNAHRCTRPGALRSRPRCGTYAESSELLCWPHAAVVSAERGQVSSKNQEARQTLTEVAGALAQQARGR